MKLTPGPDGKIFGEVDGCDGYICFEPAGAAYAVTLDGMFSVEDLQEIVAAFHPIGQTTLSDNGNH